MKRISKMDYYAGAFITSIINSAKGAPPLFVNVNHMKYFDDSINGEEEESE